MKLNRSIRLHLTVGIAAIALFFVGFGTWASFANLSGAVVASGKLVVESDVKRVQHRDGGIVASIPVRDGDVVKAGDLVMRLDDTITRANLTIIERQIVELLVQRMRLSAERDQDEALAVPEELSAHSKEPAIADLIDAESSLFDARRRTLVGQKQQLRQRIDQIRQEIDGLSVRRAARDREITLIDREVKDVTTLFNQGLVPQTRAISLQREQASLDGERGQLSAEIARSEMRITETELQILQLDQDRLTEVLSRLREGDDKLAELRQRRVAAQDQLQRAEMLAPQAGIVHQLSVHTVGGVVEPGETVMLIVPDADALLVEVRVRPSDIDQMRVGEHAMVRLSAFNQRTTPELEGSVATVAADTSQDKQTNETFYVVRVRLAPHQTERLKGLTPMAGMPAEVFVETSQRTALNYLMKPFTDQFSRAMRED